MNPDGAFFDDGIRPYAGHQLAFADDLSRAFHEGHKDLPGAAAQTQRPAVTQENSLLREKSEGTEVERGNNDGRCGLQAGCPLALKVAAMQLSR